MSDSCSGLTTRHCGCQLFKRIIITNLVSVHHRRPRQCLKLESPLGSYFSYEVSIAYSDAAAPITCTFKTIYAVLTTPQVHRKRTTAISGKFMPLFDVSIKEHLILIYGFARLLISFHTDPHLNQTSATV